MIRPLPARRRHRLCRPGIGRATGLSRAPALALSVALTALLSVSLALAAGPAAAQTCRPVSGPFSFCVQQTPWADEAPDIRDDGAQVYAGIPIGLTLSPLPAPLLPPDFAATPEQMEALAETFFAEAGEIAAPLGVQVPVRSADMQSDVDEFATATISSLVGAPEGVLFVNTVELAEGITDAHRTAHRQALLAIAGVGG